MIFFIDELRTGCHLKGRRGLRKTSFESRENRIQLGTRETCEGAIAWEGQTAMEIK